MSFGPPTAQLITGIVLRIQTGMRKVERATTVGCSPACDHFVDMACSSLKESEFGEGKHCQGGKGSVQKRGTRSNPFRRPFKSGRRVLGIEWGLRRSGIGIS